MEYQAFLNSFDEPIQDLVNYSSDSTFDDEESLSDVSSKAEFTDEDEEQTGWDSNLIESYPEEVVSEVQVQLKQCLKCNDTKCQFKDWSDITVLKIRSTLYRDDQRYRERKLLILYQKHIASIKNLKQKSAKYKTKVASYDKKKAKTEAIWSNTSTLQVADGDEDWLNKNVIFWFVSDLVEKTRRAAKIEIR